MNANAASPSPPSGILIAILAATEVASELHGEQSSEDFIGRRMDNDLASSTTSISDAESLMDSAEGSSLLETSSSDLSDLGWIIPTAIVCIFAMLGLAFACYFGVRKLELRMFHWCREHCACCCHPDEEGGRLLKGDAYDGLARGSVRLRDFRERAPSYGVTRDRHEEYVPRRNFNPFDD